MTWHIFYSRGFWRCTRGKLTCFNPFDNTPYGAFARWVTYWGTAAERKAHLGGSVC